MGRCVAFAAASDLVGAAGRSARTRWPAAGCSIGALIAWLHLIQPVARVFGRVRGLLSPPDVEASAHVATLPWTAPSPSVWSTAASARLQVGGTAEWAFWSETWIAHSTVLTALVAALRASRPARRVDIDDGWHTDRDLSISVGRWGWLHVRALVEEHAEGRCLCRVAARLQPSVRGILRAVVISAVLVAASSAAIALRWPWVSMAAVASALALFVSAAWQTTRSVAVLDRALARVTDAVGHDAAARPGRRRAPHVAPSTVLHKGQAALVVGVVARAACSSSGLFLSRDLAPRATARAGAAAHHHAGRPRLCSG